MQQQDMTDEQYQAILRIAKRHDKDAGDLIKSASIEVCGYGAVMVPVAGMVIGIEKDGHAHT